MQRDGKSGGGSTLPDAGPAGAHIGVPDGNPAVHGAGVAEDRGGEAWPHSLHTAEVPTG